MKINNMSSEKIQQLNKEIQSLRQKLKQVKEEKNTLHETHIIYRGAIENAKGVPYMLNFERMAYDFFGEGCLKLLGVPGKEINIETYRSMIEEIQIIDNPDNLSVEEYSTMFLEGKLPAYNIDARILTPQGDKKWISDDSVPIFNDKTGKIHGCIGILQDITKRKNQELTSQALEKRYRLLFELSPTGIILEDDNGIIVEVNPAICQSLQRTREELIGMDARELSLDPLIKVEDNIRRILAGEELHHIEPTNIRDGSTCMMELHETAINLPDGTRHILVIAHDITERVQLENQLRHSQRMEAVGRMAGGIAHDFNNLLTIICGYCELTLLNMKESDPNLKRVQLINEGGRRAEAMTQQLLAFSRRQVLKQNIFDLNERIHDLTTLLERLIGANINLKLNLCKEPALIKSDAGQLDQVIMNLVINARDAMPEGGTLFISSRVSPNDSSSGENTVKVSSKQVVCLSITDNGFGMDDEVQKHIFEPFFTTRAPGEGTGLGLSTAYGIIKQSGGYITVSSELNIGTTFDIYLPVHGDETAPLSEEHTSLKVDIHGSERILIAEDEQEVRNIISESLIRNGYAVEIAKDGFDAYEQINKNNNPPDLLLTDVVMRKMGGIELVSKLKEKYPNLKVMYISGYANLPVTIEKEIMILDNYLQKPFTPIQLVQKVREILDKK